MNNNKKSFSKVLLVDDSEIDVLINRRLIELTSFAKEIIVVHTAEDALNYLSRDCSKAEHVPDWIFLDMHLPGMSGYEFANEFLTLPNYITGKSRIVVLSVFQKPERAAALLQNEAIFTQIDKPLTQEALGKLMQTALESANV
ncbi:MAG: Chemotaxis response regulator protein-glutamate methylesterase [Bacteroidota bacterium]|jgi:CheY-like chemotaxis protein